MNVSNVDELRTVATRFVQQIAPRADAATVVTLSGELGAGKTTFAQAVAKELGVEETVTSPTYVIEKVYQLPMSDLVGRSFARLVHIDAYRLESAGELKRLAFAQLLDDPQNLILLEWPEKVAELVPIDAIRIRFDIAGDGRTISFDGKKSAQG